MRGARRWYGTGVQIESEARRIGMWLRMAVIEFSIVMYSNGGEVSCGCALLLGFFSWVSAVILSYCLGVLAMLGGQCWGEMVVGFGGISLADLTFRSGRVSNGDDGLLCFIQGWSQRVGFPGAGDGLPEAE